MKAKLSPSFSRQETIKMDDLVNDSKWNEKSMKLLSNFDWVAQFHAVLRALLPIQFSK